jgi:hypothetical protein
MPLIPIALQLAAQFAPDLIAHLIGPNAAAVAEKVVGIAQQAAGQATPDAALKAIQADPNLALQFQKAVLDQTVQLATIAAQRAKDDAASDNEADRILTERVAQLEGTASDLKAVPILGPAMLFLRGSQRIVIGYGTAWLDYEWLVGALGPIGDMQQRLLMMASLLVFAVLFGERAIKNVAPVIVDILAARAGR